MRIADLSMSRGVVIVAIVEAAARKEVCSTKRLFVGTAMWGAADQIGTLCNGDMQGTRRGRAD
jgi:hypothetical protein